MKHHELTITKSKNRKRSGRGISAGRGKTAGRGTKGQSARSGGKVKSSFEGGQVPLARRIPKLKGFTPRPKSSVTVATKELSKISGATVDSVSLAKANVIDSQYRWVKLIKNGDVDKKYTVKLPAISDGAKSAIEKAGGSYVSVEAVKRQPKDKTKKD